MARTPFETSRDYAHPYRPLLVRIYNALARVDTSDPKGELEWAGKTVDRFVKKVAGLSVPAVELGLLLV